MPTEVEGAAFDPFGYKRFADEVAALRREVRVVMATQAELAAQLGAVKDNLVAIGVGVDKVSTETETLVKNVADLTALVVAGGVVTPELQAAADAVAKQAGVVADKVKAVDDLVPDAPPTPTP